MSSEQFREQGIQLAKARRPDDARKLLQQALKLNPRDEIAWLYMATVARDKKERLLCLQKVLEIDPENEMGIKAVQAMGIDPAKLIAISRQGAQQQAPESPPEPEAPFVQDDESDDSGFSKQAKAAFASEFYDEEDVIDEDFDDDIEDGIDDTFETFEEEDPFTEPVEEIAPFLEEDEPEPEVEPEFEAEPEPEPAGDLPHPPPLDQSQPGIPVPDVAYLEAVLVHAENVAMRHESAPDSNIEWILKEKGRAGERDIWTLRLQVFGAIAGVVLVLGLGAVLFFIANPEAQATILGIRTATFTFTPSLSPTATEGLTDTPSPTRDNTLNPTFTPTPTVPLTFTPVGQIGIATARATDLYLPEQADRFVRDAAVALDNEQPEVVAPTMEAERIQTSNVFNPNPYYYLAVSQAQLGNTDRALEVMEEAEQRLADDTNASDEPRYRALVNLGFAEVHIEQALDRLALGDLGGAQPFLELARERAQAVIDFDPRYTRAHILLAQSDALQGNYSAAITTLNEGQLFPDLLTDTNLIIEKGLIYQQQGLDQLAAGDTAGAAASFDNAAYQGFLANDLDPFDERAYVLRIETALAAGQPGDAKLLTEDYRLAYPDSARAFKLLGDARLAEGKTDEALLDYTQALALVEENSPVAVDILLSRAKLFAGQNRFDRALADYTDAFQRRPTPEIRALRMQAAYASGEFDTTLADVQALADSGVLPPAELNLIEARVLIDQASENDTSTYQRALGLLNQISDINPDLTPVLAEYRARAYFALDDLDNALASIGQALNRAQSGIRHYLRGQIYQAREELPAALNDYEWVLTWDTVFSYPFAADVMLRVDNVEEQISANATATVEAVATVTAEFEVGQTATARILTVTAEAE